MFTLRPYQQSAIESVLTAKDRGVRRALVVAPTGAGKATLAAELARLAHERRQRVLFVAHRRELILQAHARFVAHGLPASDVGVIMAGDKRRNAAALVQIASIDTLRLRTLPAADLVMFDEAHRAVGASFFSVQHQLASAFHVGFTATPYRADGAGLGKAYDELVLVATPRELIADGFLVEPKVFTVPAEKRPDLSKVKVKAGDYNERDLAEAMNKHTLVGDIIEHWKRLALGVRTVVFATDVMHSKHIAQRFRDAGIPAEHLDAKTPVKERAAILARLERGETLIVSNVGILVEGWDQPAVKCAILARPTMSTGVYLQQAGRILRPFQGQPAIILDHAGCALAHGLPQEDREFALDSSRSVAKREARNEERKVTECMACHALLPHGTPVCTECQTTLELRVVPSMHEAAGELVAAVENPEHRAEWDRLCRIVEERGYKPGWAWHQFCHRFGHPPPRHFRKPVPSPTARHIDDVLRAHMRNGGGQLSLAAFDLPSR